MRFLGRFSSTSRRSAGLCAGCLLAFAASGASLAAQVFEAREEVFEVRVPVTVTLRDGSPVRGLTVENFELLEEGQRREITGFETIDLEQLRLEPAAASAVLDPAGRRQFLLLFDLSFSSPAGIARARQAAQNLVLKHLHPTDLVAVATHSLEHGPQLLVTFTPDRLQVARVLQYLGGAQRAIRSGGALDPLRFLVELPASAALEAGAFQAEGGVGLGEGAQGAVAEHLRQLQVQFDRSERSRDQALIQAWSRAFGEFARALGAVSGRKHVLYFSEGFDSRLLLGRPLDPSTPEQRSEDLDLLRGQTWLVDSEDRHGSTRLQQDVYRMLQEFVRADCVIQAVDVGGLRPPGESGEGRGRGEEALFYLAHETGGRLLRESNNLEDQLQALLEDASVTYVLTFRPQARGKPGQFRKIKVRVPGVSGARVLHRAGYTIPRPFRELPALERELLASNLIAAATPSRDIGLALLAPPFRATGQMGYLPVILEIEGRSLLAGQKGKEAGVEIYGYLSDTSGQMREFFNQLITVDLSRNRSTLERVGLKYYGHLFVAAGEYLLRVLVRNRETGRVGTVTRQILVPDWNAPGPFLLPPLFLDRSPGWLLVRDQRQLAGSESVVYPFTLGGEPFVPAAEARLAAGAQAEICLAGYHLGDGLDQLRARVLSEEREGPGVDVTLRIHGRFLSGNPGLEKLQATLSTADLPPGRYRLEWSIAGDGPSASAASTTFRIDPQP